jgi:hypothetical protein
MVVVHAAAGGGGLSGVPQGPQLQFVDLLTSNGDGAAAAASGLHGMGGMAGAGAAPPRPGTLDPSAEAWFRLAYARVGTSAFGALPFWCWGARPRGCVGVREFPGFVDGRRRATSTHQGGEGGHRGRPGTHARTPNAAHPPAQPKPAGREEVSALRAWVEGQLADGRRSMPHHLRGADRPATAPELARLLQPDAHKGASGIARRARTSASIGGTCTALARPFC